MVKIKALLGRMLARQNNHDSSISTNATNIAAINTQLGELALAGWVNVTSSASKTFTHDGVFRGILVAIGNNANTVTGMYMINNTGSSHLSRTVVAASQLTVSVATERITVSSGISTNCHVWMICLEGTGEWT